MFKDLHRPRSEPSISPMSPNVAALLQGSEVRTPPQSIIELARMLNEEVDEGYRFLLNLDREMGGVGLHNVNRLEGDQLTGAYRIEFRPIFRPIQYVESVLDDLVWGARYVVQWSCGHAEDSLKYRFKIPFEEASSMGILLTRKPEITKTLDPSLLRWLQDLNRNVYRGSKHSLEETNVDAHRFTPADAIAVYLMCRWAGVTLLTPTGVFKDWKMPTPST